MHVNFPCWPALKPIIKIPKQFVVFESGMTGIVSSFIYLFPCEQQIRPDITKLHSKLCGL